MTYEDIVFDYNNRALDDRTWDMISDRERVEFVLRVRGMQEPVAEVVQAVESERYFACDVIFGAMPPVGTKLYTTPQPCQECDAQIEAFRSAVVSRCLAFGNSEHSKCVKAEAEALANLKEAIRGHQ